MKKQSILFLALLAAVSCQKENTQDIAPVFDSNVELRASFDEQSSRIATEDGLTFSLEEGKEQIGVYINLGDTPMYDNVLYTAGSADEQGWISFSTDVPVHVQSNSKFFAYAPYSATTVDVSGSTDGGAIEPAAAGSGWNGKRAINLPDLQEQPAAGVKTDIAKYYSVVAAPATPVAHDVLDSYSVNLQFSGVFALVRFGLNNFTEGEIKISKLVFSAENAALTGYFSVDLTHENPKLSNTEYAPEAVAGKTFDKVTVTLAEPATIAAQEMAEVYAVVNACAVTAPKLTVYATDAEGKDIVFEKTLKAKTFSRQQRTAISVKLENPIYNETLPEGIVKTETGYEIQSATGLSNLAALVNEGNNFSGKTITLTDDIDLDGINWTPIGSNANPFAGKFDGRSSTISNLNVNSPKEAFKGLFGRLVEPGTISNVSINNATVKGLSQVGAIVGSAYTGSVSNCHVSGDIAIEGNYQVGGIAGNGYATISNCSVIGNDGSYVKGTYKENNLEGDAVGGIIGYAREEHTENDVISGCSASIDVSGTRKVGGIAGQCGHTANLGSCTFSGNVATNADETYIAGNAGKIMVGGLVGELTNDGGTPPLCALYIRNCTVTEGSTVTGVDAKTTGAILGGSRTAGYTLNEENNTATGVTVTPTFAEGIELTPDGTYNIVSAAGVKSLAELVNAGNDFSGKTVTLTADIDLDGIEWTPIGNGTRKSAGYTGNAFKGTFDGNDKTISGLKIANRSDSDAAGLIGVLDGGTVKNVTLNVDIDVAAKHSELAAGCVGLLTNKGLIENVTVNGSVKSEKAAAGIVSRVLKSGTVRNCHNHATVSGTSYNIGGIVGAAYYDNEGMTIEGCTNDGAVSGTYAVGGIAGLSAAEVKNCSNSATVTGNETSVGGVIGEQQNAGSITRCTNTGNVKNNTEAYGNGGIVGWIRYTGETAAYPHKSIITVSGCENRGSVSGGNDAGGIVGTVYSYGNINNNKNYAPTLSAKTFVAGVVGNAQFTEGHPGMTDEEHVYVTDNYSETTLDNMTGGMKAKFVYINNSDKTTDSGNTPDNN